MLKQLLKQKNLIGIFVIIVIFLIFIKNKGFKKITERFENANLIDVINGLDVQDQKLNDMVKTIDVNNVIFNKSIISKKAITAEQDIYARNIISHNDVNAKNNVYAKGQLVSDNSLRIGGDSKGSLDRTDIMKLKSLKSMAGYAVDGSGTTHLIFEGGWYSFTGGQNIKFDAWSNDAWDVVYLFRGWEITLSKDANGSGSKMTSVNNNEDVKRVDLGGLTNQASSYLVKWVGY